uniref:Integrase, catalytic region, zinc finger, CCHC-type, peptidase aspartic, catalytic n=1 Tax=Tanacetum cinerariifolium TaxID=118510 RepID=A0A6L2J6J4_TANCI|nr:integrase, catalytic region, zinc finger, CCHC-type, peptidase aspartic, catalytic [Tanacetum cinerariifolium]
MRLKTDIKPKEATFQVMMDALALTLFYRAFLIIVDVLAIYMQEFRATVSVHKSSIRFSINKKKISLDVEFVRNKKITTYCKKAKVKDYEYYKTKMLLAKKDKDEQVLSAEDQAWMESSSDLDQDINANMVFIAQIEKVLSDSEASSSSADEKIFEVSYYLSESESESEYETSEYYDNSTNYGLFVNNDDDQENFHDAIESASENFIENHIDSQKDYDKSDKRVEKANQQSKDFENQDKDLQDKYEVLKNQTTTFEMNNKELNEQLKELIEMNNDLLAQTKVLKDQLQVKHVVIDTHVEYQENMQNLRLKDMNLDTFSSVRRPKNSSVIWKKKGSSNTSNVGLSPVSVSNLNKNVKRYSCKDLLACNNSHLGETSSAYMCNDAINVSCDSRMNDLLDDNNFFIFNDVNVRISHIVQICLWIIDSRCSKHMTGNRALLTNFVEIFLGTVRFGNNDFAVIAGYGDVVIGSMTIKKVYYVEGLGHNLFSVGQFCDKGLEVAFRKFTCFARNEDGVDLLTGFFFAILVVASTSISFKLRYNQ